MSRTGPPLPPRLAMVCPRYYPCTGGLETHVHEVATRLARRGWQLTVVTADITGRLPAAEHREGVEIRRCAALPQFGDAQYAPGLPRLLAEVECDLIHVQGVHTFVPVLALRALRGGGLPYVVSFHTGGHSSRLRNLIRPLQWALLGGALRRATRLVAVSQFEARLFSRSLSLPEDRFTVVPNGFEFPCVEGEVDSTGPLVVVSLGRLEHYKGHHRAIGALTTVLNQEPDVQLWIVGEGPDEARLRRLAAARGIAGQVHFCSFPPERRAELGRLIATARLVVLFSEYEAHPVAVMEAVGLGRRVLVADNTGLREIAELGLARAVPLSLSDHEIGRAMLGELARPTVEPPPQLPDWDTCTDRLADLYLAAMEVGR